MERDRTLNGADSDRHPIEELADEYGRRLRSGDRPSVAEYVHRYPDLAEEIQELLPAVALMERCSQHITGTASSPAPPRRLGDFLLLREIGRGGMGLVYEARQVSLERRVALKVLPPGLLLDATYLQRFRREAAAAARLHHTNIVPVFGLGECDGVHFFTMQFIPGRNLQQRLKENVRSFGDTKADPSADTGRNGAVQGTCGPGGQASSLPQGGDFFRFVARAGIQAAEALAYAHHQGVLHRDIKPSNLILDEAGTVWVTDFGLAKAEGLEDLTATGDYVGTLRYLAPERLQGQVDARSDVYSLGLTLYELATGQPGFDAPDRAALVQQVIQAELAPPRQVNPAIPRDLEKVLLKALEREPARRYQTGQELADDLRRFLADLPVRARPLGTLGRAWRWCRRNPALAGLTAAVALALLLGTAVSMLFAMSATERAREAEANARQAREAKWEADRRLYVTDMRLAQRAWEEARISHALELLDRQRPQHTDGVDLRGFEWFYWNRLCHADLLTLRSRRAAIFSMAVSPDGRYLVTGGGEKTHHPGSKPGETILWDLSSGQELRVLGKQPGSVGSVAFSPDGRQVAAASGRCFGGKCSGAFRVWDVATGRQVLALDDPDRPFDCVSFSPDGKLLALTCQGGRKPDEIQMRDAADGQLLRAFKAPSGVTYYQAVFHPDGRTLALASSDSVVRILDVQDGRPLLVMKGHADGVVRVAFSRDGQRLASASDDQTIKVWDTATGRELATLKGHTDSVFSVAFDPEGQRLISAGTDQTVRLWDVQAGRELATFKGHTDMVCDALFIRDQRFLSASFDGSVKVWDEASGQVALTLKGHVRGVTAVAFSPDGDRLASLASDNMVRLWDPATGQDGLGFRSAPSKAPSLAFSPDGRFLATTGGVIRQSGAVTFWDAATGRELRTLRGHTDLIVTVAFSPDGQHLATTGNDGQVLIWDLASGQPALTLPGHAQPGTAVAFSPDGRRVTAAFQDGMVRLWDAADGRELLVLRTPSGRAHVAAFSPDGKRLVTAHADAQMLVWDTATGQELFGLKGHTKWISKVVFSPDGSRLASAGADRTVRLWHAESGQELLILRGHASGVKDVAFSPDGRRLSSAGDDGTVRVWNAPFENESRIGPAGDNQGR